RPPLSRVEPDPLRQLCAPPARAPMRRVVFAVVCLTACAPRTVETPVPEGWRLVFAYTFDHLDTTVWSRGTHTFDGNAAQFRPYNAAIRHGHLELILKRDHVEDRAYSGAELELRHP